MWDVVGLARQDRLPVDHAWVQLLVRQRGLLTARQAYAAGITRAMVHGRTHGDRAQWQRVLPRVYATFVHPLTPEQRTVAAWLYAGPGAAVTGAAALHWRGLMYLPREIAASTVDVLIPFGRDAASTEFVRITRTRREIEAADVNHVLCVSTARAAADCSRRLGSYETVLALVSSALNSGRTDLEALADELLAGPVRGSRQLRRVLLAASANVRSVPEGQLLDLITASGLPAPLVNQPILVAGRRLVPDVRWGRLIVEVDSRLHHLLRPGAWEATQARRLQLERAGYHVLPVTPEQIRDEPAAVMAAIMAAYALHCAG